MMIELMAHAAIHENPGLAFHGINNLRILKGIVLQAGNPARISVHSTKVRPIDAAFCCYVEIRGTLAGKELLHVSGEVLLVDNLPNAVSPHIQSVPDRPYPLKIDEIYKMQLFHGDLLRGIREITGWSPQGMTALSASATSPNTWMRDPWRNTWLSDPLALDVAFQMMILWTTQVAGAPSLPTSIETFRQFKSGFPENGVVIRISARQQGAYKAKADIEFLDRSDRLVAIIEGYECIMNSSLREAFGRRTLEQHATA